MTIAFLCVTAIYGLHMLYMYLSFRAFQRVCVEELNALLVVSLDRSRALKELQAQQKDLK